MTMVLLVAVVAYLLGSLSFAVIVSRVSGLPDPHTYGSGNPGATNVLRTGRKWAALLTLLGDAGKGLAAVLIAAHLEGPGEGAGLFAAVAALAAFLGHLFPVYFRFRGGKGVATAAGILLALDWRLGVAVLGVWLGVAFLSRYSSLAALSASLVAPFLALLLGLPVAGIVAVLVMSILLLWRHRSNIVRLVQGRETRIGADRKKAD
jgi:glycerol-3-phosphate acyltransferase PlsY